MRASRLVLLAALLSVPLSLSKPASAALFVSVSIAPPALPIYAQPPLPGPGYIWTPGYWSYADAGYYWVPGTWVLAPEPGLLWTPAYWGWNNGVYLFHAGYWGPHVGYYGGINYGFGYVGVGYLGGRWEHGEFAYNRAVNNVNITNIHNVYTQRVDMNGPGSRVSFNGGPGGTSYRPSQAEEAAEHERHVGPTPLQATHEHAASANPAQFANTNHGRPAVAASVKPAVFSGRGVVLARPAAAAAAPRPSGQARPAGAAQPHGQPRPQPQPAAARPPQAPRPPAAPRAAAPAREAPHEAPHERGPNERRE